MQAQGACAACGADAVPPLQPGGDGAQYKPGYVIRLEGPPPPAAPPAPPDCCLLCNRTGRPGRIYFFYAAQVQGMVYQVVHQEGVLICHRCAENHLGLNAWRIVGTMLLVGVGGLVVALFLAGLGKTITAAVLGLMTLGFLGRLGRRLQVSRQKPYRVNSFAAHVVTRLAIQLRRQAVLRALALPEMQVVFLSQEEHRAKLKARRGV
jgi:hypothetical protein